MARAESVAPRNPWLVTSTMPPMPARGRSAAGFGHARDRERRGFGLPGALLQDIDRGHVRIEQVELRQIVRQQRRVGEAGEAVLGRGARHRHRALGQGVESVAPNIVGRNHRLPAADQYPQADIVALGTLRFLDGAFAHLDRKRNAAHRDGVGGVGAGAFGGADEAFGEIGQRGLIEQ